MTDTVLPRSSLVRRGRPLAWFTILTADATETELCVWLSAILLAGLGLNSLFGWWWADPVAGLAIVAIPAREGWEHGNAEEFDDCC